MIKTKDEKFNLRFAKEDDCGIILGFIKELAIYEDLLEEVVATEEILKTSLFVRKAAEVVIGEYDGVPVSYMLFVHNFSTFLGKPGIYLEDLYVKPEMRGKGLGTILLSYLGKLALERDCGRVEWSCLDWNKKSIDFYKGLGAEPMEEWTVYRVTGDRIGRLANEA